MCRGYPDLPQGPCGHPRIQAGRQVSRPATSRRRRQVNGISASTALWYASRATGVVALLLLTAVMVLGILVNRQGRLPGLPRFGATSLHRSVSLMAVAFIAMHVIT